MDLSMFKAYDIRSRYENLSGEIIRNLSDAIAIYYREDVKVDSVVLCRDARINSPELLEALMESLTGIGLDVYVNPLQTSTCQFYYMCMKKPGSGGIMVTASHNPGDYVGVKLVGREASAIAEDFGPDGGITRIREYYRNKAAYSKGMSKGHIHVYNALESFIDYSMELAGIGKGDLEGLKILADFLSGSAGMEFAMAFEKAGAEVMARNLIPDGLFPSGEPNPVKAESMKEARNAMKDGAYDLGFAFDGDGDRMDLMFPDGTQMIPGLNMSILLPYIKDIFSPVYGNGGTLRFFSDIKSSPIVLKEMARSGVDPHIIRNGHSFIKGKLHEYERDGYIASVEESSHYYMNFPYDSEDLKKGFTATENTLFFALLTARAYKEHPEKYREARKIQENISRIREWTLTFDEPEMIPELLERIEKAMVYRGASAIRTMDDGTDLDATLFRFNLPSTFSGNTDLPSLWCQVSQRISRSEDARTRWEVVASDKNICEETDSMIRRFADEFVLKGWAHY